MSDTSDTSETDNASPLLKSTAPGRAPLAYLLKIIKGRRSVISGYSYCVDSKLPSSRKTSDSNPVLSLRVFTKT